MSPMVSEKTFIIRKKSDYDKTYPIGSILRIGQRRYKVMLEPEFVAGCNICSFREGLCQLSCMHSEREDNRDVYFKEI